MAAHTTYYLWAGNSCLAKLHIRFVAMDALVLAGTFTPKLAYARWQTLIIAHTQAKEARDNYRQALYQRSIDDMQLHIRDDKEAQIASKEILLHDDGKQGSQQRFQIVFQHTQKLKEMAQKGRRSPWLKVG